MILKTIEQWNQERKSLRLAQKTGVACPQCGQELIYKEAFFCLASPTARKARCPMNCVEVLLEA